MQPLRLSLPKISFNIKKDLKSNQNISVGPKCGDRYPSQCEADESWTKTTINRHTEEVKTRKVLECCGHKPRLVRVGNPLNAPHLKHINCCSYGHPALLQNPTTRLSFSTIVGPHHPMSFILHSPDTLATGDTALSEQYLCFPLRCCSITLADRQTDKQTHT